MRKPRISEQFVRKLRSVKGYRYEILGTYKNSATKIRLRDTRCGNIWSVLPTNALSSNNCPHCDHTKRKKRGPQTRTHAQFSKLIAEKYDGAFKLKSKYRGSMKKIKIEHRECGSAWKIHANRLMAGSAKCLACTNSGRNSPLAIRWLRQESKRRRLKIQHAGNGGEFHIEGTQFCADGYNKKTNTVFEFYGDGFHGNPEIFEPKQKCHPFKNITAGSLYKQTLKREKLIKRLGYNLVTIWERDFRRQA